MPGTIEAMARDAITFIEALGLDTIDVVGHSMGGLVALLADATFTGVGSRITGRARPPPAPGLQ